MSLTASDITVFLLSVSALLFFGRGFGEVFRKFKQPMVVGEIIAGIVLGPTILGALFPEIFESLFRSSHSVSVALQGLTLLGVVMLLLVSGIEIDLSLILRQSKAAALVSLMGVIFPFSVGFVAAYFFPAQLGISDMKLHIAFALFVGTALSITALPVVARTLMDLNLFKTEIGFLIVASAMFNDLIGWIIFSIILGMIGSSAGHVSLGYLVLLVLVFIFLVLVIGRKIINWVFPYLNKFTTYPGGVLNFILVLGFIGAAFTESIGVHAIFGAFIVGIAIGDSAYLKEETREVIQQFVTNIFAPLFFVSIGLNVDFIGNFDLGIVLFFLTLAFFGKVVGCGLGAYWGGFDKYDSLAIGFGMNSRGAMEIVLGTLAFQYGLIQEKVFVALVIMALVTSITGAPFMDFFLHRKKSKNLLLSILKPELIFYSSASGKLEIIKEICSKVSSANGLNCDEVTKKVLEREESISTGLEKGLAIPHAKLKIKEPVIGIALHKDGVDFDSFDRLPAKLVFLLLTPESDPEIQLKLLAEISKKFADESLINQLVELKKPSEIISKVKQLY